MKKFILLSLILFAGIIHSFAAGNITRLEDVVYDHREGVALVMDVLIPENPNGMAIFRMVSGGWVSKGAATLKTESFNEFTDRGATVFLVCHGSRPRYKVPEIVDQIQRAVRFVRYNAEKFAVDPDRFVITGSSSGGHLSISVAVHGQDPTTEEEYRRAHPKMKAADKVDPVELVSSRVQAVACFYPPTNLIDYTDPGSSFADDPNVAIYTSALFPANTTKEQQLALLRASSPYYFISDKTPPTLIIHGTADPVVPYRQSPKFIAELEKHGIPCKLITKEGAKHSWPRDKSDDIAMIEWFEKYAPSQSK